MNPENQEAFVNLGAALWGKGRVNLWDNERVAQDFQSFYYWCDSEITPGVRQEIERIKMEMKPAMPGNP